MNKKLTSILLSTLLLGETSSFAPIKAADPKNTSQVSTEKKNDSKDTKINAKKIALGVIYAGALAGYGIGLYSLLTKDNKSTPKCGEKSDIKDNSQNMNINPKILDITTKGILSNIPDFKILSKNFPIEYAEINIAESILDRNMKLRFKGLMNLLKFVRTMEENPSKQIINNELIEIMSNKFRTSTTYDDLVKASLIDMLKDISKISFLHTNKEIGPVCNRIIGILENSRTKAESNQEFNERKNDSEESDKNVKEKEEASDSEEDDKDVEEQEEASDPEEFDKDVEEKEEASNSEEDDKDVEKQEEASNSEEDDKDVEKQEEASNSEEDDKDIEKQEETSNSEESAKKAEVKKVARNSKKANKKAADKKVTNDSEEADKKTEVKEVANDTEEAAKKAEGKEVASDSEKADKDYDEGKTKPGSGTWFGSIYNKAKQYVGRIFPSFVKGERGRDVPENEPEQKNT